MTDHVDDTGTLIVRGSVSLAVISKLADGSYGAFVKAVVDLGRSVMAVGGEMHAGGEALLLADGSLQADLWGINLFPNDYGSGTFIEFESMINLRPRQGNRTTGVDDPTTRMMVADVVARLVQA